MRYLSDAQFVAGDVVLLKHVGGYHTYHFAQEVTRMAVEILAVGKAGTDSMIVRPIDEETGLALSPEDFWVVEKL